MACILNAAETNRLKAQPYQLHTIYTGIKANRAVEAHKRYISAYIKRVKN